jgi:hypothetical protein
MTPEIIAYNDRLAAVDPRAIAHFLYTLDISQFNHRVIPFTSAAQVSKERGLSALQRYFLSVLERKVITLPVVDTTTPPTHPPTIVQGNYFLNLDHPTGWVRKIDFFDSYMRFMRENNEYTKGTTNGSLWHSIYAIFPSWAKPIYHSRNVSREYTFCFPPIKLLRDEWRTKMRFWEFEDEKP